MVGADNAGAAHADTTAGADNADSMGGGSGNLDDDREDGNAGGDNNPGSKLTPQTNKLFRYSRKCSVNHGKKINERDNKVDVINFVGPRHVDPRDMTWWGAPTSTTTRPYTRYTMCF